ncbi:MAG: nucleotidyltransferase family protein [Dehalococcoidia bacterium]
MTTKSFTQAGPVRTALVLAGGKGERLRPLTDDRPKPMVLVNGAPILEHHLAWLRSNGIERAVLLVGYLHQVIRDYFAFPRIDGLTVECVGEETPLGRGGAFRNGFAQAGVTDEVVIATNGDVLTDQPLAPMLELHERAGALATLLLTQMVSPFGIVETDEQGRVRSFVEKPRLPVWINGGAYVLSREIFEEFPVEGDHETTAFPRLAEAGRIAAFKSTAFWRSVESPKDLREAGDYLAARS